MYGTPPHQETCVTQEDLTETFDSRILEIRMTMFCTPPTKKLMRLRKLMVRLVVAIV